MKKMQQEQQQQAPATRKKPRIKRTYSAPVEDTEEKNKEEMGAASHSMSNLPTVKMEEEEEEVGSTSSGAKRKRDEARESGDGMVVAAVKKVARVAKRRKKLETQTTSKPAPEDNETIMKKKKKKSVEAKKVEVEGENGDSSNGSGEVPATPLHERRRRFEGKVFFLLGRFMRKQAEMQAFIEENGGEVAKSITRKVTHLLTAQGDDGTLAFKQARQRSLKIITEERLN
ncbi:BRCA1 C Terminus (BRCT) domain containing protein, partial [Acanthamoeba castellanii str. Neff]